MTLEKPQSGREEQQVNGQRGLSRGQQGQVDLTPGRDPAEGADVEVQTPLHERWAQDTFDRAPTEGEDVTEPAQGGSRKQ